MRMTLTHAHGGRSTQTGTERSTTMNWEQRHTVCRERALARCPGEDTTMIDYGAPCPHTDENGLPISCTEAERRHSRAMSLTEAGHLADLVRAVERSDRFYWYPVGASGGAPNASYILRAFTHDGGGLWFDKDGDVRDAYVWLSGITELWLRVSDIIRAMENVIDMRHGEDKPMCRIEARS